jgi:hypothetical protein
MHVSLGANRGEARMEPTSFHDFVGLTRSLAYIQQFDFVVHEFPSFGGCGEGHAEHRSDVVQLFHLCIDVAECVSVVSA